MAMETWSQEEVGQFLVELGYPEFKATFMSNDIDGQLLCILDDPALSDLGVDDAEKRKHILAQRDFCNDGSAAKPDPSFTPQHSAEDLKDSKPAEPEASTATAKPQRGRRRMQFKEDEEEQTSTISREESREDIKDVGTVATPAVENLQITEVCCLCCFFCLLLVVLKDAYCRPRPKPPISPAAANKTSSPQKTTRARPPRLRRRPPTRP